MKFGVIGAGAIGTLFSALLAKEGQNVIVFPRQREVADEIERHGIRLEGEMAMTIRVKAAADDKLIQDRDVLLVAVKAYDTASAAFRIADHVKKDALILTLQNGLGNVETLKRIVPDAHIVGGSTTMAAILLEAGHVRWTGKGRTTIGVSDGDTPHGSVIRLAEILNQTGTPTSTTHRLNGVLWLKTLVSAGINPVTALLKMTNGELMHQSPAAIISLQAINEGAAVARAEGVPLGRNPVEEFHRTVRETSANRSSMLQDLENHRKTEIDYINGAIVDCGKRHSITTPVNNALCHAIRALEGRLVRATAREPAAA